MRLGTKSKKPSPPVCGSPKVVNLSKLNNLNNYRGIAGKSMYVAFIDFQKAFDSVNHPILYDVLRRNGVKGKLHNTGSKYISFC